MGASITSQSERQHRHMAEFIYTMSGKPAFSQVERGFVRESVLSRTRNYLEICT